MAKQPNCLEQLSRDASKTTMKILPSSKTVAEIQNTLRTSVPVEFLHCNAKTVSSA